MSEANILNASATDQLNQDYGYSEGLPEMRNIFQAQSGNIFQRRGLLRGRSFDLTWLRRPQANIDALRQWERQYENDFFTLVDWARTRYYSGRFESPLIYSPEGNDAWTVRGRFTELPGKNLNTYPVNWGRDAIFIEEDDGSGNHLAKLAGTWTHSTAATAHGSADYFSNVTNDTAEWLYFGYGLQFWSRTQSNFGKVEVTVTRVRDGVAVAGPTIIDLYSAGPVNAAALMTAANLPLDLYRVKARVTGTKNVLSSDFFCSADAIQVMQ